MPPEESAHTTHKLKAISAIFFLFVLFGIFWYFERAQKNLPAEPIPALPLVRTETSPEQRSTDQPVSLSELQAAALNTAIPDYSQNF